MLLAPLFETTEHPFDRRMALELQALFVDDDWDTEFVEEPRLTKPEEFTLDGTHPDLGQYAVYPTVLEARRDKYFIRAYFIKSTLYGNKTSRIRLCTASTRSKSGKAGYRDAKVVAGPTAAETWRLFKIAFKVKPLPQ